MANTYKEQEKSYKKNMFIGIGIVLVIVLLLIFVADPLLNNKRTSVFDGVEYNVVYAAAPDGLGKPDRETDISGTEEGLDIRYEYDAYNYFGMDGQLFVDFKEGYVERVTWTFAPEDSLLVYQGYEDIVNHIGDIYGEWTLNETNSKSTFTWNKRRMHITVTINTPVFGDWSMTCVQMTNSLYAKTESPWKWYVVVAFIAGAVGVAAIIIYLAYLYARSKRTAVLGRKVRLGREYGRVLAKLGQPANHTVYDIVGETPAGMLLYQGYKFQIGVFDFGEGVLGKLGGPQGRAIDLYGTLAVRYGQGKVTAATWTSEPIEKEQGERLYFHAVNQMRTMFTKRHEQTSEARGRETIAWYTKKGVGVTLTLQALDDIAVRFIIGNSKRAP